MAHRRYFLWMLLLCAFGSVLGVARAAGDPRVAEAREQALGWLALTDAGKSQESWQMGASAFKAMATPEKWSGILQAVRAPLGATKSRRPRMAQYTTTLSGAPDGEYVVLGYFSSFENKAEAEETVILAHEGGAWRTLGYFLK